MGVWSDLWSNIIASLIGAAIGSLLGYFGGIRLIKRQQKEDEILQRNMVVNSIMWEIDEHDKILEQMHPYPTIKEIKEKNIIPLIFPTASFNSIVSSGLFSRLKKEVQKLVSTHYFYCRESNKTINILVYDVSLIGKETLANEYVEKLNVFQDQILKNIKEVKNNLKQEKMVSISKIQKMHPDSKINIQRADKAFEQVLLLLSILQAVLFQLIIWLLKPPDELYKAIGFCAVFGLPFLISLSFWVRVIISDKITERTVLYRLISWASLNAGFTIFGCIFIIFTVLKEIVKNPYVGTFILLVAFGLLNNYCLPFGSILNIYRQATSDHKIWSKWYGIYLWYILYAIITFVLIIFLSYMTGTLERFLTLHT